MAVQNPNGVDPAEDVVALTGSAMTLATDGRGLLITVTGNIVFTTKKGTTVTFNSIPVGLYGGISIRTITSSTCTGYVLI